MNLSATIRLLSAALVLFFAVFNRQPCSAMILLYCEDYDGGGSILAGVTGGASSTGTSIESVQGLTAAGFSGNFERVNSLGDVIRIDLNNIPAHAGIMISFDLAMLDSWDNTHGTYGTDIFNMQITNSAGNIEMSYSNPYGNGGGGAFGNDLNGYEIIENQQMGFNPGTQPWWDDSAYDMTGFPGLQPAHSSSRLLFELFPSSGGGGAGFQGDNDDGSYDESFGIDNVKIWLVPEPSRASLLALAMGFSLLQRRRLS